MDGFIRKKNERKFGTGNRIFGSRILRCMSYCTMRKNLFENTHE